MKEEIKKIDDMIAELQLLLKQIYKYYDNKYTREVVFSAMVLKKSIDILAASKLVLKNYIITVQISLIRLLCDNCLAIEAAIELGLDSMMDLIQNNQQVNTVMLDEEQNMSDGYLKRKVADKYRGFDRIYRFACEGVHFSSQSMGGAFIKNSEGEMELNTEIGNKNLKDTLYQNNEAMITVCKVIMDMLKEVIKK